MWDIVAIWSFHTICTAEQEIFKHCQAKKTYKSLLLLGFPRDFNGRSLFFLNSQLYWPFPSNLFEFCPKRWRPFDGLLWPSDLAPEFLEKILGDLQLRWLPISEPFLGRTAVCCDLWGWWFFQISVAQINLPDNIITLFGTDLPF